MTRARAPLLPLTVHRVVVPLDGSREAAAALPVAAALAQRCSATVHLVHVVADEPEVGAGHALLAPWVEELAPLGPTEEVRVGDPAAVIAEIAADEPATVLCLGARGAGRLGAAVLGSVAERVVATADVPAVVVGPNVSEVPVGAPVVACVDGGPESPDVVLAAARWARMLGLPLTVLTVVEPVPVGMNPELYRRRHGPAGDASAYVHELAAFAAASVPGVAVESHVAYHPTDVVEGVLGFLAAHPATAVAAWTHGRTGWARLVEGSVTASLVRTLPVPVLLVRPAGSG